MNEKITILIADDNPEFAETLVEHLSVQKDMEVIGVARDGKEACEKVTSLKPDVLLLDVIMPYLDGLGFASKIEIEKDEINIPKHVVTLLADGIKAFIPSEELVDLAEEKAKLEAEKTRLEAEVARSTKMLSNPGFINKAPEAKVQEEKEKMQKYKEMLEDTIKRLEQI